MGNLLALIVGPGNCPLIAIILLGVPSGVKVVFVISRWYYTRVTSKSWSLG